MKATYCVWYKGTKELIEDANWHQAACFSSLKRFDFAEQKNRYFKARFNNALDKSGLGSTKEWLHTFDFKGTKAEKGIVKIIVHKDYYYVTLDLSILSYEWAFSLLTLFRYPGEYYNICWNFWKIKKKYPTCTNWEALFAAHQGSWFEEYKKVFNSNYNYNYGHSIFKQGQSIDKLNIEATFERLEAFPPYANEDYYSDIQPLWCTGYANYLDFDKAFIEGWKHEPSSD